MKDISKLFPYPTLEESHKFLRIRRDFLKAKTDVIEKLVEYEDIKEWAKK